MVSPIKSPLESVPITGTPVFLLTRENTLNIMPSCANAYSNRGEGSKDTTAQPITFMNFCNKGLK